MKNTWIFSSNKSTSGIRKGMTIGLLFLLLHLNGFAQLVDIDSLQYPAYNFGFHFGIEQNKLTLQGAENSELVPASKLSGPGFHCGMLFNYSFSPKLAIQVIPNYVVGHQFISFTGIDSLFLKTKKLDYFPFQFPVMMKYNILSGLKSRPYINAGVYANWDLSRKIKRDDAEKPILLLNKLDYGLLFGFGIDQKMFQHTISIEIKYFSGFNNLLNKRSDIIEESAQLKAYTSNLSKISAETLMVTIKLE